MYDVLPPQGPTPAKRKPKSSWPLVLIGLLMVLAVTFSVYRLFFATPEVVSAPEPQTTFSIQDSDTYAGDVEGPGLEALSGPGVAIPSVNVLSTLTHTDVDQGKLVIPEPPDATWYEKTAPLGSKQGTSMLAGHVNFGYGEAAPFHELHRVEKGAPIFVRDFKGVEREYKIVSIDKYQWHQLPESLFTVTGEPKIVLLTCSGPVTGEGDYKTFLYNLVVTAVPVG